MIINTGENLEEKFLNPQYVKNLINPKEHGGNVEFGISRWPANKVGPLHKHDDWDEYFYILSGIGVIRVGEETHELKEGSGVRVPKGMDHAIIDSGNEGMTMVYILSPKN